MAPVSNGSKNVAPDVWGQGPVRHWHTVGLDIPCQVARLQSLTPLLQDNPYPHAVHTPQSGIGN
jgi:hypothetical protein